MFKITRSRNGCWTCKERHRKCDETKPACKNCTNAGRKCLGYGIKLSFDVDDKRVKSFAAGFRGRPRLNESLSARNEGRYSSIMKPIGTRNQHSNLHAKKKTLLNTRVSIIDPKPFEFVYQDPETEFNFINMDKIDSTITQISELSNPISHNVSIQQNIEDANNKILEDSDIHRQLIIRADDSLENIKINPFFGVELEQISVPREVLLSERDYFVDHFFKNLLPFFDNSKISHFPTLIFQFCEDNLAVDCILSLSAVHLRLLNDKESEELYMKGSMYNSKAMDSLINFILSSDKYNVTSLSGNQMISTIMANIKELPPKIKKKNLLSILILIHSQIMFSILDSGRSGLLEFFFELISRIGNDYEFSFIIGSVEKAKYLMVTFAWFDTLCSLVSFPPRKVFSNKRLFSATDNEGNNIIETISGCPGKIFSRLVDISNLRYCSKNGKAATKFEVDRITKSLLNYRSYLTCAKDKSYLYKLKAANCWALAGLTVIEKLKQFKDDDLKQEVITGYIFEFIDSYKDLELVELKLQMAWPVFTLGLESRKMHQRVLFKEFLSFHYSMSKMANVEVMNNILTQSWETGASFEGIMKTKHWSGSGIALIPT